MCGADTHSIISYTKFCKPCSAKNKKEKNKIMNELNIKRNKNRDYSLDVGGKVCSKCKEYKEYKDYNKCYKEKDGYKSHCKICKHNEYIKEKNKISNKAKTKEYKDRKNQNAKLRRQNPIYSKKQNQKRRERAKNRKEFYETKGLNDYQELSSKLRKRLRKAFKDFSVNGKIKKSCEYGIDYATLINKMGLRPSLKHSIDHIIPCIVFNFDNPSHVFLCQHPENLRWLELSENSSKSDRIEWGLIEGNIFLESVCLEIGITKDDDGKDGKEIRAKLYKY